LAAVRLVKWPEGWSIQPDLVISGPTIEVPAHPKNNVVEWITVTMPGFFGVVVDQSVDPKTILTAQAHQAPPGQT
jgi:hypothetical protein